MHNALSTELCHEIEASCPLATSYSSGINFAWKGKGKAERCTDACYTLELSDWCFMEDQIYGKKAIAYLEGRSLVCLLSWANESLCNAVCQLGVA